MRKVTFQRDDLYQWYVIENRSTAEIGTQQGVTSTCINQWLRKFKIPARTNRKITCEELRKAYFDDNLEPLEIAKKYGMAREAVYHRMRMEGITYKENPLNAIPLTESQREFCFGSLLGDASGSLSCSGNCYLKFAHSHIQEDYLRWKHQVMLPFSMKICEYNTTQHWFEFVTRTGHQFKFLHSMFYPESKKIVPDDLSLLTPFAIAVWYMDDGSINRRDRRYIFATNCFSDLEVNRLIEKLATYNVIARLTHRNFRDKHYPIMVVSAKSYTTLRELMLPYVIPSMRYKVDC